MQKYTYPSPQPSEQKVNTARKTVALVLPLAGVLMAAAPASETQTPPRCEDIASIGTATMAVDGTITLRLRSLPPGPIGEGVFHYAPNDANYQDVLSHIQGGIKAGETKPVRPWC